MIEQEINTQYILSRCNFLPKAFEEDLEDFIKKLWDSRFVTVFLAGNGGSASTVSHFSSDLDSLGFFTRCLCDNIPRITALTNDRGWDKIYIEQLQKLYREGDVLIVASVHGGVLHENGNKLWSGNLAEAVGFVKENGGIVLALLGDEGGAISEMADISLVVPSPSPYVVEPLHSLIAHHICEQIKGMIKHK